MNDRTTLGIFVAIHGHFYQPPRENPYLEAIERQPSAHPSHDWNERVYRECYRPNAWARVFNDRGEVIEIVNNFEYLSFNVGPTLLSWLEGYDPEVYERILAADRHSCQRLNGHGNAIAQAYNHAILPLANARDRRTQILWGIADFRTRFGRDPEGMWLPETAVDYPTLVELAAAGIRFVILAPSQAARCRPLNPPDAPWQDVSGDRIDPTRPYRCFLPDGAAAEFIDLFFYDGESAREIAFGTLLHSAEQFSDWLARPLNSSQSGDRLLSVATDGETFGHHKTGGERCLAYAFTREFPARGWQATNFAHYLSEHPPVWEAEIVDKTAWSCAHGLGRWQTDCGCGTATDGGAWRQPLRESLDWLRDRLAKIYELESAPLLRAPWQARDAYGPVTGDRALAAGFLRAHQQHFLSETEATRALCLLEMQRQALLMYTSCGWFFEELSRPEGVQILRYAMRAMDLARQVTGEDLEAAFLRRLVAAPSNLPDFQNGADIYRQLVAVARVTPAEVAVHCAIAASIEPAPHSSGGRAYCYRVACLDYRHESHHDRALGVGHFQLVSAITWERYEFVVAALHINDWEFRASVLPWEDCPDYETLKVEAFRGFDKGEAAAITAIAAQFGEETWTLDRLFGEERERILQQLGRATRVCLERSYERVYQENYQLLVAFRENGLPVPPELRSAAAVVLSQRCMSGLRALECAHDDPDERLAALAPVATAIAEAQQLHCQLQLSSEGAASLQRLLCSGLEQLLQAEAVNAIARRYVAELIELAGHLQAQLSLDLAQELYFQWLRQELPRNPVPKELEPLLEIGRLLRIADGVLLELPAIAPAIAHENLKS